MEIKLPKVGFSMADGVLTEWLAHDGKHVEKGEPLYALEAEKAVQEIAAPISGTLKIRVEASAEVLPVGTVLGEIL